MAFGRNNTKSDFETMLRRHLEQANRHVPPCSEYDPEVASAFLEGALNNRVRSGYESHLAGCASCRHSLVMLQKIAPAVVDSPRAESSIAAWWRSLKEALSLPVWGVGLAAAAGVLVLAVGVNVLRQRSASLQPAEIASAVSGAATAPAVSTTSSSVPTTSPGVIMQPTVRPDAHRDLADQRGRSAQPNLGVVTVAPSTSLSPPIADPKTAGQNVEAKPPQSPVAETQVAAVQSETRAREGDIKKEDSQRQDTFRSAQAAPSQAAASQERSVDEKGARRLAPREAPAKAKPQPTPRTEDENFRPLIRKIRDKAFRFDRGVWIDQEYRPENRLQRTRLVQGSSDYDRVLAESPSLAPFFDLGAVIVVWQGRVYEVRK